MTLVDKAALPWLPGGLRRRLAVYRFLAEAQVRPMSRVMFPIRRRAPRPYNRLDLKSGASFESAVDEQLLTMFDEIWLKEVYLPPEWRPTSEATVVDVGANVGVFSIWAERRLHADRIIAVEPTPSSASALLANLVRNGIRRAHVVQTGLSSSRGDAVLYGRGAGALNTLFTQDLYDSQFTPTGFIRLITLDDLFDLFAVDRCDLLKLDCEGAEYDILFGAGESTLARIRHIAIEYHVGLNDHDPQELHEFLERSGFEVTRSPPLDVEGGYLHASRPL